MVAFDVALRGCRHNIASVPVKRIGRSNFRASALLDIFHLAGGKLVPRCRERHVVVRHGEARATRKRRCALEAFNSPTYELVPFARRLVFHFLR